MPGAARRSGGRDARAQVACRGERESAEARAEQRIAGSVKGPGRRPGCRSPRPSGRRWRPRRPWRCRRPEPRESSGATLTAGTAQLLEPDGIGCGRTARALPSGALGGVEREAADVAGTGRARVGHGRPRDAGTGAQGLSHVGAGGVSLGTTAGDLEVVEQAERDEATVGLEFPRRRRGRGAGRERKRAGGGESPHAHCARFGYDPSCCTTPSVPTGWGFPYMAGTGRRRNLARWRKIFAC